MLRLLEDLRNLSFKEGVTIECDLKSISPPYLVNVFLAGKPRPAGRGASLCK
jgi:hypothetical protein